MSCRRAVLVLVYARNMQSRDARCSAIFAGYTALGLFIAAANSLTYLSTGNAANWIPSIKRSLGEWCGWAALTPLILMLAERRPIQRGALCAVAGSTSLQRLRSRS